MLTEIDLLLLMMLSFLLFRTGLDEGLLAGLGGGSELVGAGGDSLGAGSGIGGVCERGGGVCGVGGPLALDPPPPPPPWNRAIAALTLEPLGAGIGGGLEVLPGLEGGLPKLGRGLGGRSGPLDISGGG